MMNDELKDTIRQRLDIVELIQGYVKLKRAGTNYKGLCPFHQEKTPSFSVNPSKQMYYCFGCQRGGDHFQFVMDHEGVDFPGALEILAQRAGISEAELERSRMGRGGGRPDPEAATRKEVMYRLHTELAAWYRRNVSEDGGGIAREYLSGRGISDELAAEFAIGYAPDSWQETKQWGQRNGFSLDLMLAAGVLTVRSEDAPASEAYDRFRNRLIFPIWDAQGRVIGFSGRVLAESDSGGAKYVNSPETPLFRKGRVLYGLHKARIGIRDRKYALLCEGQIDVIACHGAGLTHAVAPQGTAFTEEQARLLKRFTDRVVVAFDADEAGIKAALRSADAYVPVGLEGRIMVLPDGEDPDSLIARSGPSTIEKLAAEAEGFFPFLLDHQIRIEGMDSPESKARVLEHYLGMVAQIPDQVLRSQYAEIAADRLGLLKRSVFDELNRRCNDQRRAAARHELGRTDTRRESSEPPQPTAGAAPEDNLMAVADIVYKSETVLLDLALHHGPYAHRLIQHLPAEKISRSPVGRALNELLAHTAQGEWDKVDVLLRAQHSEEPNPELNRVLVAPDFGPGCDGKLLEKAFVDCVRNIMIHHMHEEIHALQEQLKSLHEADAKHALRQEIMALRLRKQKFVEQEDSLPPPSEPELDEAVHHT